MVYAPAEKSNDGVAKVIYTSKDRKTRKVFKFLIFRLCPGLACKAGTIMPNEMSSSEARQNWACLIQKIYEVDPLVCSKCQGQMKIISIIDYFEIIDKILKHLNLWDIRNHDPPEIEPDYIPERGYPLRWPNVMMGHERI
jgi:hypothetical protein